MPASNLEWKHFKINPSLHFCSAAHAGNSCGSFRFSVTFGLHSGVDVLTFHTLE